MTANPASVSVLALTGCLLWGCLACMGTLLVAADAWAQVPASSDAMAANPIPFDIAAQDLGSALNEYSRLTGLAVLIDSADAKRPAGAVRGSLGADEALRQLLAGTGLRARHADAQSVVISPTNDPAPATALPPVGAAGGPDIPGITGRTPDFMAYIARVQQSLRDALCASPQTRPGPYRLALQLRLDARGMVERFRLLDTTGQAARDAAIARVLRRMAVGAPPPAAMAQPVAILLLPEGPSARSQCPSAVEGEGEGAASITARTPDAFRIVGP
jgi:hypothetical protein